jgi:hypothetical protein
LFAIVAKPIVASALAALLILDIAAQRARAIVMVDAPGNGLIGLIQGVKARYVGHLAAFLRLYQ